eukprot:6191647-Ditylum_brightwellii.AAC.1
MKRKFQQSIRQRLEELKEPNNNSPSINNLTQAIKEAEQELLLGNPEKDKPWFITASDYLLPLCDARDHAHMRAHTNPSERNQQLLRDCNKHLNNVVDKAKNEWAEKLAKTAADYKTDPVKSWKAVRTLEKGLPHHHSTNRTIRMQKKDKTKAKSDQENAK